MLISLDIETACAVGCTSKCDHALDEYRNRITVAGLYYEIDGIPVRRTIRDIDALRATIQAFGPNARYVGHNLKFDLRSLATKGIHIASEQWVHDTQLMAASLTEKIPERWLEDYEAERKRRKVTGEEHRRGTKHSLKTLAPYFLGVEPFWETADKDDDTYVLRDVEYAYKLCEALKGKLEAEGSFDFYHRKLLPWTKMLLAMEQRGIRLDMDGLARHEALATRAAEEARKRLETEWAPAREAYQRLQEEELDARYDEMTSKALLKAKDPAKCAARYRKLREDARAKLEPLNLDSPTQLTWLMRDYLGLDITDFDGEETTGKAVLQKLAGQGREDVATFLNYRKQTKLATAFFPTYRAVQVDGIIHTTFNPTGARTGRLSSSGPNLQQVERGLHGLFVARPGYKLATYDMSAIEPRLIAFYTEDPNLYRIIANGEDFHGYNTKIFFELECDVSEIKKRYPTEREVGKEVGLALMYGAGARRLQESAQKRGFVWSLDEARRKLERFKKFYQGVYRYRERVINPTLLRGPVTNLLGRQFRIPNPEDIYMQGLNTLIQGSASDLVIHSAYRMTRAFAEQRIDAHPLLLVHDEVVVEIPASRADECVEVIRRCMTDYPLQTSMGPIILTVEGKVADSWEK